jgi:dTMP kinase
MTRGRLIVFEGVEGAGKTTQLERLAAHLTRAGAEHRSYREPGGTPLGNEIRRILLDPAATITPRAEALLFMASRAELLAREVRPAIKAGHVVLLDRFFLSTYAYQIAGRGLPETDVRSANLVATEGLVPDLTILITVAAGTGLARAQQRSASDRMEQSGDAFHGRVERAFADFVTRSWQQAHEEAGPIVAVDGSGSADEVHAHVVHEVTTRFPELRAPTGAVA